MAHGPELKIHTCMRTDGRKLMEIETKLRARSRFHKIITAPLLPPAAAASETLQLGRPHIRIHTHVYTYIPECKVRERERKSGERGNEYGRMKDRPRGRRVQLLALLGFNATTRTSLHWGYSREREREYARVPHGPTWTRAKVGNMH